MINNKFSISVLDKHLPVSSVRGLSLILKSKYENALYSSLSSRDFIYNARLSSSFKSELLNNTLSSLNLSFEKISNNIIPPLWIYLNNMSKFSKYSFLSKNKFIIRSFNVKSLITLICIYSL